MLIVREETIPTIFLSAAMGLVIGYFVGNSKVDICTKDLKECNVKLQKVQEDQQEQKCENKHSLF